MPILMVKPGKTRNIGGSVAIEVLPRSIFSERAKLMINTDKCKAQKVIIIF